MYSWFNLTMGVLIAAACAIWWTSVRAKELAVSHARTTCAKEDLQLLDQTVALMEYRLSRNNAGNACLRRQYKFEFTQHGAHRDTGIITMNGHTLLAVKLPFTRDEQGNRVFLN